MPDLKGMTARTGDAADILLYNNQKATVPDISKNVLSPNIGETKINIDYYIHDNTTYPGLSPLPSGPNQLGSNGPASGLYDYSSIINRSLQNISENTELLNFREANLPTHLDISTDLNFVTVSDLSHTDPRGVLSQVEGLGPEFKPKIPGSSDHFTTVLLNGDLDTSVNFPGGYAGFSAAEETGGGHYSSWIVLHEGGHPLGLAHPFGISPQSINNVMPSADNEKYTVMSYNPATIAMDHGHAVGLGAIDIAALEAAYGDAHVNTGDTKYYIVDGTQISGGNNAPLDIDGDNESHDKISDAFSNAANKNGFVSGTKAMTDEVMRQFRSGQLNSGAETLGRGYKSINDGIGKANGGIDEISYTGSKQNAFINLNDAEMRATFDPSIARDQQFLDLQREVEGSDRYRELNGELKSEVSDETGHFGGYFSKLYTTNPAGKVDAVQDGGYSIAKGVVIENASGGDAADTIIGNEHDNVLNGNKGADALFGGHGNDTLNGGQGNDSLVAGRGNNTLDGGADFDTASYKDFYDPSVGTPSTQGIRFSTSGNQTTITKPLGGAIAGPLGASVETDTAQNIERFEGSSRDDVFTVENLSGNLYISGGGGKDTLTVKDPTGAFTLDMTGGTYPSGHERAGESYSGTVSNGTDTIYLENKDIGVTIDTPPPAPAPTVPSAPEAGKRAEISLGNAIEMLAADQTTLNQEMAETGVSSQAHQVINHPDAFEMIENLRANGVNALKADIRDDMGIEERVGTILSAGQVATREAGIAMPQERRLDEEELELEAELYTPQYTPEPSQEEDNSAGL